MTFWIPLLVYKYLLGENSSAVAATGDDWWWDQMPPSCIYDTQKGKMNAPKRTLALIARFLHVSSVIFALPNKVYKVLPQTNYTHYGAFFMKLDLKFYAHEMILNFLFFLRIENGWWHGRLCDFRNVFDFIVPHDNNKSWQITPM